MPTEPYRATHVPVAPAHEHHGATGSLVIAAVGIVFGDIGTSPLYTFQECVGGPHGAPLTTENVLGVLSLIFWALMLVVTTKYVLFMMRADNAGEGGILALLALVPQPPHRRGSLGLHWIPVLVLVGASLLFGDGIITPAISVLSAIEGLEVATPGFTRFVVPLTCVILLALFSVQHRGTGGIGKLFGPVMVAWFVTIGTIGAYQIVKEPSVIAALSPLHAVRFFARHGQRGFFMLGSVVLAVTGGEALYADMGHFGARAIRIGWTALVLPALALSYFGQGALVLRHPAAISNPFFAAAPHGMWTYALVALAAPATVIASQALISGVFSLTHQAVRLGYFPRVLVKHTSRETEGQIYVPALNWGLAIACIALVLAFQRSTRLANAYGLAVSGTMAITSVVFFVVTRRTWKWSLPASLGVLVFFLSFDIPFLVANLLKFFDGGYLPVLVGAGFFIVMLNWRVGRSVLYDVLTAQTPPPAEFFAGLQKNVVARTPGTGVFMASAPGTVPPVLHRYVQRLRVLPERVVILTVTTEHVPTIDLANAIEVRNVEGGVHWIVARAGFTDRPNVPEILERAVEIASLPFDPHAVTYYLGRETFVAGPGGRMGRWAESLFAFLSRNSHSATAYFAIPPEQVVELGSQIDL